MNHRLVFPKGQCQGLTPRSCPAIHLKLIGHIVSMLLSPMASQMSVVALAEGATPTSVLAVPPPSSRGSSGAACRTLITTVLRTLPGRCGLGRSVRYWILDRVSLNLSPKCSV